MILLKNKPRFVSECLSRFALDIMPQRIVYYPYRDNIEANTMGRLKGSLNKKSSQRPITSTLNPEERIRFIANLIIDRILDDQHKDTPLLNQLKSHHHEQ